MPAVHTRGLGLIEAHAHLLPNVDDGSRSVAESISMARQLVERGYSHLFCTPHHWPNLPENEPKTIARKVADLQIQLDAFSVPLKLHPGGEINLRENLLRVSPSQLPSYDNAGKHLLVDSWLFEWPTWLTPLLKHLQSEGHTVILAHPERLGIIQDDPDLYKKFQDLGLLLQGNLYCFADAQGTDTRETADYLLEKNAYWIFAGDHHREDMGSRFRGLDKVIATLGLDIVTTMLRDRPATLLQNP